MQTQSKRTANEERRRPPTITVVYAIDHVVVTLAGELDSHTESDVLDTLSAVHDTLSAAHSQGFVAMRIDTTTINFLDASGIRSLLALRQLAHDHKLGFSLATTDDGPVVRLLDLCGLTKLFADKLPVRPCL